MSNPYEVTAPTKDNCITRRSSPFLIGARNGFLWSLLLAVPASFALYNEYTLSMANHFDPVTLTRTQVPLTGTHRIAACIQATITASLGVVLPWTAVAGLAKLARSKKLSHNVAGQSDAHRALDRPF
jgi:hypothetical protein